MANNPPVQRWFMEGGALPPLLGLLADPNVVVRTKAVHALSALVRHYAPGLEAFRLAGGLTKLLALLGCSGTDAAVAAAAAAANSAADTSAQEQHSGSTADAAGDSQGAAAADEDEEAAEERRLQQQSQQRRLTRKVLALLHYMLLKHPADRLAAAEYGVVSQLQSCLKGAPDSDMRQAALSVLVELLAEPHAWEWVQQHEGRQAGLVQQLQRLQQQHAELDAEDREAEAEEGQLLGQCIAALQSSQPPPVGGGGAGAAAVAGMEDHVDLDPYQDGGERAEKTVSLKQPQQQQPQQEEEADVGGVQPEQQGGGGGAVGSMAIMAVPKQELR
jgi:hsp70-interacting protein